MLRSPLSSSLPTRSSWGERELVSIPMVAARARKLEIRSSKPETNILSNPRGWKMVASGRGGRGTRPPEYGTPVGCTPTGVLEPLSPCRVTSVSGTPPGCSLTTRRFPGGRCPFAPERPPAIICQPFGLGHSGACFRGDSKVDADALRRGINERAANTGT